MTDHEACPVCGRSFVDLNAAMQHTKKMHGKKASRPLYLRLREQAAQEPSMADLVIQASMDQAMGLSVDPDIAEAFGDYL